ncbi:MAG: UDP-N-acetylmuramoyl-tripeptide--D-alanyl-D-alanine ligase [Candidatus Syntrophonatronum acetioxidans]|uniref:UDP-N-acetylmuramoyl-tripeptide--D-alanyl-D-alanine ligase n=1 Tax=Candidatus Syntrophonatronum acetioxidans TaxID=1795816 RepID=A0A424YAW6_9FIRM|nr:MAG: UDP-N-acetylmuramoyl-tripeptide--D-alanyl-D-alanine ligase [Candidatus Syntrophonatronum acetioxidans]
MAELFIKEIIEATGGTLLQGDLDIVVKGFSIDTRSLKPGEFFIPLKGDNTDGHQFVRDALGKGASGAFISREMEDEVLPSGGAVIKVSDTLLALQQLSRYHREKMKVKIIGITGSAGKTTTKDLLASILNIKYKTLKTECNLNNHIGLPLMLLQLLPEHQFGVLEMGMRGQGEIRLLAELSRPQAGIITNIGEAHFELLGSLEAIARAKGELLEVMGTRGVAVLNGDNRWLRSLGEKFPGKVVYFGLNNKVEFQGYDVVYQGTGTHFKVLIEDREEEFFMPLPGEQNLYNALAALSCALYLGITPEEVRKGLGAPHLTGMRLEVTETPWGATLINDAYNANLSSTKASLKTLAMIGKDSRQIAVLGDMLELGSISEKSHREVGDFAVELGVDFLLGLGNLMLLAVEKAREKGLENAWHFWEHGELIKTLERIIQPGDFILIKGSRGMRMEKVVDLLKDRDRGE